MFLGNHTFTKDDELHHARQMSREKRFTDMFNRDMERSDPVMLSYEIDTRVAQRQLHKHEVPQQVLDLMSDPVEDAENN